MRLKEFLQSGGVSDIPGQWDKLPMSRKISYIKGFLTQRGYSENQTAAIIGNLIQENRTLAPKVSNDVSKAIGIAQWLGPRKQQLMARKNPYNILTQLEHLDSELKGNEHWTNNIGGKKAFFSTDNVEKLTHLIRKDFERPGEHEANDRARIRNAYAVLGQEYSGFNGNIDDSNISNGYDSQGYYGDNPQYADMSQFKQVFEDMRSGIFNYEGLNQAYKTSPEFTEMMMSNINQSAEMAEKQRLEQERLQQEENKKIAEQENLQIQQALDLKRAEREQMLAMVPQLRSVTQGNISPQI